jgi:large repetitive protein
MRKTSLVFVIAAVCLAGFSTASRAGTIARWTFENNPPSSSGPISADVGAGTGTAVHAVPDNFSNPSGNGSGESWNTNSWAVDDYYQFQVSTLGQSEISFSWDQTRSSSGPGNASPNDPNFRLQYSTDGSSFTDVVDYFVPAISWNNTTADTSTQFTQDLSSITALNNQANVYFRLTAILPPLNSGGQSRIDNILVTSVPEPTSLLLLVAAAMAAARVARIR